MLLPRQLLGHLHVVLSCASAPRASADASFVGTNGVKQLHSPTAHDYFRCPSALSVFVLLIGIHCQLRHLVSSIAHRVRLGRVH